MRAIVLEEPGRFAPVELPEAADPGPGEALVAIRRVGVCGTDLHAFHGRQPFFSYPRILGHELGVEVVATGPGVTSVRPGDRCALRPYLDCGACDTCRRGRPNCCTALAVLGAHVDGGMRERLVVPADHLHPSATLSLDHLALVETLSIGGHAVARVDPKPEDDERALVIGAGPVGLAVATFLRAAGVAPVLADVSADRRRFAEAWARVPVVDPEPDPTEAVLAAFRGEPPTLVFDATGNATSMAGAFRLVANGGRLVFVGLVQADITFFDPDLHRRELTLHASRNATASDFDRTLRLLESGTPDLGPWVTERCMLDEVPAVFPTWADGSRPGQVKGIVSID